MLKINDYKKWHFVGVGGVSMSKLCAYLVSRGFICTGSDSTFCDNITELRAIGVNVCIGISETLAENADIVVYNSAIPPNHKERLCAKVAIERKELLGLIESQFKYKIAVAGAHGKTSVSGMLSYVMRGLGSDVMANVGGDIIGLNSFDIPGNNEFIVTEACEYSRSFLQLNPDFSIIVNVDYDHPDCYRDIEDTYDAFSKFLINTKKFALVDKSCHAKLISLSKDNIKPNLKIYTFGDTPFSDYYACNIARMDKGYVFNVMSRGENLGSFYIESINAINIKCATIVIAACDIMGLSMDKTRQILKNYKGVKRRMELLGNAKCGAAVYTDYAHHPKEILSLYNNLPKDIVENSVIVFQPHTYSRTQALFEEFALALKQFKHVIILPTYPAREQPSQGKTAYELYEKLLSCGSNCYYSQNWEELKGHFAGIKNTDTLLLVGAGIDYMGIFQLLKQ